MYFLQGFLFRKCTTPDVGAIDPELVYKEEIVSGRQYAPNVPGLMNRVKWGETRRGVVTVKPTESSPETTLSRVDSSTSGVAFRCGLLLDRGSGPDSGTMQDSAIVFFQNVGTVALDDDIMLLGIAGPALRVKGPLLNERAGSGVVRPWGLYGTRTANYMFEGKKRSIRMAPFRLQPTEVTYMHIKIPDINAFSWLQADVYLMGGDSSGLRNWGVTSGKVELGNTKE
jgi:hypothetical protein